MKEISLELREEDYYFQIMMFAVTIFALRKSFLSEIVGDVGTTKVKFLVLDNELSVGDGTNIAIPSDYSESLDFNEKISIDGVEYPITRISNNAFYKSKISSISFSGDIKEIGSSAFFECQSLASIQFKPTSTFTSIPDFFAESCDKLAVFSMPNSVTHIGRSAFKDTIITVVDFSNLVEIGSYAFSGTDITTADFSNSQVTKIPDNCFRDCDKLKTVILNDNINFIGDSAFNGTILEGEFTFNLECEIGPSAFTDTLITKVEFLAPVELKNSAFNGCKRLTTVIGLQYADIIPNDCFSGCSALVSTGSQNEEGIIKLSETLKSIGDNAFKGCTGIIRISIEYSSNDDDYTIGNSAFADCTKLEFFPFEHVGAEIGSEAFTKTKILSIVLPKVVLKLGSSVACECRELQNVDLSETAITEIPTKAFYYCDKLESVNLPSGLQSIGVSAFELTLITTDVTFPSELELIDENAFKATQIAKLDLSNTKLQTINSYAFYGCQALSEVKFPDTFSFMDTNVFEESGVVDMEFPASFTKMRYYCFQNCEELVRLDFGKCVLVEELAYMLCTGCTRLETLILPPNLVTIRPSALSRTALKYLKTPPSFTQPLDSMFEGTDSIIEVDFSESRVSYIGLKCFMGCEKLETVRIPGSCTSFKMYAFNSCPSLKNVIVEAGNLSMIEASCFRYCVALEKIDLSGTSIDEISANAFADCKSLETVLFPSDIHSIHVSCFEGCSAMKEFTFPSSINRTFGTTFKNCVSLRRCDCTGLAGAGEITTGMFEGCTSLKEIILPSSLEKIRPRAFQRSGLETITIGPCPIIDWEVFSGCQELRAVDLRRTGVTILQTGLFEECPNLETVILPDALSAFNSTGNMFENSLNIKSIYYMGSTDLEELSSGILDEDHKPTVYVSVNYLKGIEVFDRVPVRIEEEEVPIIPDTELPESSAAEEIPSSPELSSSDEELSSSPELSSLEEESSSFSELSSSDEELSSFSEIASSEDELSSSSVVEDNESSLEEEASSSSESEPPQDDDDIWAATGPGTIGVAVSGTIVFVAAIAVVFFFYIRKHRKPEELVSTMTTADTTWILDPSLSNLANVGAPEARTFWNDYIEDDNKKDDAGLFYFG